MHSLFNLGAYSWRHFDDHNQSSGKILWGSSLKLAVGHFNCWVSFPRWSDPKAIKTALNLNSHTSESSLEVKAGALCISLLDFVKKTPTVLFLPLSLVWYLPPHEGHDCWGAYRRLCMWSGNFYLVKAAKSPRLHSLSSGGRVTYSLCWDYGWVSLQREGQKENWREWRWRPPPWHLQEPWKLNQILHLKVLIQNSD